MRTAMLFVEIVRMMLMIICLGLFAQTMAMNMIRVQIVRKILVTTNQERNEEKDHVKCEDDQDDAHDDFFQDFWPGQKPKPNAIGRKVLI